MSILAQLKALFTQRYHQLPPKAGVGVRRGGGARVTGRESGFTLVELLVVLGIIGLLVAIATPQVIKYLDRAKVSTARTQIEHLSTASDLFKIDVGRYPTTEEGIAALVTAPAGVDNWRGPYLKKGSNLNDPWGKPYQYRAPGQYGDVDIYSLGPTGAGTGDGGNQAITNR